MYFRHGIQPLSNDTLRRQAPAIFAENPSSSTSDKYLFIPTINLVEGLQDNGWSVVSAVQTMNRATKAESRETNKHSLFFARTEMLGQKLTVDGTTPLIGLKNSHNGLASFELTTGFFRGVCSNGLTVPETLYSSPKVKHTQNMRNEVIEATYKVLNDFPELMRMQEQLASIELSMEEKLLLGDTATEIFFTKEEREGMNKVANRYRHDRYLLESQLITARRHDDRKSDLWTVTNVIQENLIRGNVQTLNSDQRLQYKRKVTSIDRDKEIHEKLFAMAEKFAALKGVKIGKVA